jgi:hypothetical protein
VVYVVARPGDLAWQRKVQEEASLHRDMVYMAHVQDNYRNITYQTLEVLRAAYVFQGSITHVLKCDDDTYVACRPVLGVCPTPPNVKTYSGAFTQYLPSWASGMHHWIGGLQHSQR